MMNYVIYKNIFFYTYSYVDFTKKLNSFTFRKK